MEPPKKVLPGKVFQSTQQLSIREDKVSRLSLLFPQNYELEEKTLTGLVNYIEENRSGLTKMARKMKSKSLYLKPKETGVCFHIQITSVKKKKDQIFIMPKLELLGVGNFKKVRTAFDYNNCKKVASATIRGTKREIKKGKKEFFLQRKFNQSLAYCLYSHKNELKMKIVMPLANQGSLDNLIEPDTRFRYHELTSLQRTMLLEKILKLTAKFHKAGYIIADIKPENILWSVDEKGKVRVFMTDLGLSYHEKVKKKLRLCGTPQTIAPEIVDNMLGFNEPIHKPVDIFALGFVIWNVFIGGTPPWLIECNRFGSEFQRVLVPDSYEISWTIFGASKGSLEEQVHQMMHPNQSKRPTIEELSKALAGKDPKNLLEKHCGGIRLLSCFEKSQTVRLFLKQRQELKQKYDLLCLIALEEPFNKTQSSEIANLSIFLNRSLSEFYTLSQHPRDPKMVVVTGFRGDGGKFFDTNIPFEEKIVQEYLESKNLKACLNFWQFVV